MPLSRRLAEGSTGCSYHRRPRCSGIVTDITPGSHDFDVLFGTWEVTNRRLTSLPTGATDWIMSFTRTGSAAEAQ